MTTGRERARPRRPIAPDVVPWRALHMMAGHDRGARTAYRMHSTTRRAFSASLSSTSCRLINVWTHVSREWALNSYHWSFMAQPYDFPERLLAGKEEYSS